MKHFHLDIQLKPSFPLTVTETTRDTFSQTHTKLNVQFAAEVVNHFPLKPLLLTSRAIIAIPVLVATPLLIGA